MSEHRDDGGLVDGDPPRHQIAHRLHARGGVARKTSRRLRSCETAGVGKPRRKSEMVQRDHGLHPVAEAGARHVDVVLERIPVEPSRLRLDARPFDREAVHVVMHRPQLFEVGAIASVLIDRDRRIATAVDGLGMIRNPSRPVVVDAALHLVRRSGAPQKKPLRQLPRGHPFAAGASSTSLRNPSDGSSTITFTPFLRLHARTANACSAIGEWTSSRSPGASRAYALRTCSSAPGSAHSSSEALRSSTVVWVTKAVASSATDLPMASLHQNTCPGIVRSTACATHRAERPPTPVPAGGLSCAPGEAAHNAPMPTAEPARHDTVEDEEDRPRPVAGTVRLMTEDPFEIDDDADSGFGRRLSSIASKSPWVIPAVLVGIGVAFLVLRRRR